MIFKRRFVPVVRDFPEGCGDFSGHKSNAGDYLMQSKIQRRTVQSHRDFPDFSKIKKESSNYSEIWNSGIGKDESIESNGGFKNHQEKEVKGDGEDKQRQGFERSTKLRKTSLKKNRRLSLHNSTMKVQTDVVNTSKRVVVLGLAAKSKCPWRQPKPRSRGSRQVKD